MTKFKKIAASMAVALAIGTVGVSAYAVGDDYFDFLVSGQGQSKYSDHCTKISPLDYAVVRGKSGDLTSTNFLYLSVFDDNNGKPGSVVSKRITATSVRDYSIDYTVQPVVNDWYYLPGADRISYCVFERRMGAVTFP